MGGKGCPFSPLPHAGVCGYLTHMGKEQLEDKTGDLKQGSKFNSEKAS